MKFDRDDDNKSFKNDTSIGRTIIADRGGSLVINNMTGFEGIQLNHQSGSNINMINGTTSIFSSGTMSSYSMGDAHSTTLGNTMTFTANHQFNHTQGDEISIVGIPQEDDEDKPDPDGSPTGDVDDIPKPPSMSNGCAPSFPMPDSPIKKGYAKEQKKRSLLKRMLDEVLSEPFELTGGFTFPNGYTIPEKGTRAEDPNIGKKRNALDNFWDGANEAGEKGMAWVNDKLDEASNFTKFCIPLPKSPQVTTVTKEEVAFINNKQSGLGLTTVTSGGSGTIPIPEGKSHSTMGGNFDKNPNKSKVDGLVRQIAEVDAKLPAPRDKVNFISGDIAFVAGPSTNDSPKVYVNHNGRTVLGRVSIGSGGAFSHEFSRAAYTLRATDSEASGNMVLGAGNRMTLNGIGGFDLGTVGCMKQSGSVYQGRFHFFDLLSVQDIDIKSQGHISMTCHGGISLHSNTDIMLNSTVSVSKNLNIGGGMYVGGELICEHISIPQIKMLSDTTALSGKFPTKGTWKEPTIGADVPPWGSKAGGTCVIGTAYIPAQSMETMPAPCGCGGPHTHKFPAVDTWVPVHAKDMHNMTIMMPHAHTYSSIAHSPMPGNTAVRNKAHSKGHNTSGMQGKSMSNKADGVLIYASDRSTIGNGTEDNPDGTTVSTPDPPSWGRKLLEPFLCGIKLPDKLCIFDQDTGAIIQP